MTAIRFLLVESARNFYVITAKIVSHVPSATSRSVFIAKLFPSAKRATRRSAVSAMAIW
jgi:hypothetical protein